MKQRRPLPMPPTLLRTFLRMENALSVAELEQDRPDSLSPMGEPQMAML